MPIKPAKPVALSLPTGPLAPPIISSNWINSQPLSWDGLRGKVVMVEFWTFSCINCIHVTPAMKGYHKDFADQGFTLIGVHAPEFDYEKVLANVQKAVKEAGIEYPVAIDNDFANWQRYANHYWPAWTLIDKRGNVRYSHIGEGAYDETRENIKALLAE